MTKQYSNIIGYRDEAIPHNNLRPWAPTWTNIDWSPLKSCNIHRNGVFFWKKKITCVRKLLKSQPHPSGQWVRAPHLQVWTSHRETRLHNDMTNHLRRCTVSDSPGFNQSRYSTQPSIRDSSTLQTSIFITLFCYLDQRTGSLEPWIIVRLTTWLRARLQTVTQGSNVLFSEVFIDCPTNEAGSQNTHTKGRLSVRRKLTHKKITYIKTITPIE